MMTKRLLLIFSIMVIMVTAIALSLPAIASTATRPQNPRQGEWGQKQVRTTAVATTTAPFLEENVHIHYRYEGQNVGDVYGWIGTNLGDLNGDGSNDFSVSAIVYSDTALAQGRMYIYSGIDGTAVHTNTGSMPIGLFGFSAAAAGDVNNDGTPDYIVGAPGSYPAQNQGQAIVYSGVDHSVIHSWTGEAGWRFGESVTGLGDVNGDDYDDVAVASAAYSATLGLPFHNGLGRVTVYSGQDGSVLWTRDGDNAGDALGGGIGRVSDLDGDTVPEVVVAAHWADNGNGYALVLSGADGTLIHTLLPTAPLSNTFTFGQFFTRGAGDVNNDGTEDIFVGDYAALNGDGRVYIYSGLDGSIIHLVEAPSPGDGFGPGRGVPDVNGDGHDDFIAAAYTSSDGVPTGGKVYLFSGEDASVLQVATGGIMGDNLGVDALPLGDVTGDGYPDYLLTSVGLDFAGLDVGRAYVVSFKADVFLPLMRK
jgi:hypothetical protein